jgi:hypothetical protein
MKSISLLFMGLRAACNPIQCVDDIEENFLYLSDEMEG